MWIKKSYCSTVKIIGDVFYQFSPKKQKNHDNEFSIGFCNYSIQLA